MSALSALPAASEPEPDAWRIKIGCCNWTFPAGDGPNQAPHFFIHLTDGAGNLLAAWYVATYREAWHRADQLTATLRRATLRRTAKRGTT